MVWDDLPEGWEIRRLGEVTRIGVPKGWKPTPHDGKIPFIEMADIDQETGLRSRYVWRDFDEVSGGKVRFAADAILVAKITPCTENNKTALVPEIPTNGGYATTEVFAVHPSMWTDRLYLLYFLRSPQVREVLVHSMTGSTGRQRVPKQALEGLEIPLPPLGKQRRIVARIEELTERIDAARRLRAEAVEEAKAILPSALAEVFGEAGEKGWEVETLGGLSTHVRYGLTAKASPHVEGVLFIRITDIDENGNLRLDEPHYVQINDNIYERFRVQQDDILIARSGATAGKAHLCSLEGRAVFASYLIRFRLDKAKVFPRFLFYFLHSPTYWAQLNQWKIGGAQPNVNATNLKKVEVPLPPIPEQRRIVEYLDSVQAKVEAIRRYQEETQQEIEAMTGAVLEKAFRGEL